MRRRELGLKLVPHFRIRLQVVALTREKARHRDLIVLIRLDSKLTPMMAVRDQGLVQLLDREWERQILRVPVADVAHQPVKYAI